MHIKQGFDLREVCGEHIIVASGLENIDFSQIISLNDSAAYLWKEVEGKEFTTGDLTALLLKEYEVDEATAEKDAKEILRQWEKIGLCEL